MSILFATPCYGGQVTAQHMGACLSLKEALVGAGVEHDWSLGWNESLIQRARNSMAARFLNETSFRKLMFIDADIEFEPESMARLWNMDADIAVGLYPMKRLDCPLSAWREGKLVDLCECPDEPFEVDFAGTGYMMIDRGVFEVMREAWPHLAHMEGGVGLSFAWFNPRVVGEESGPEGRFYASEDYAFVMDARSLGYKAIADPSIKLVHHGSYAYGG